MIFSMIRCISNTFRFDFETSSHKTRFKAALQKIVMLMFLISDYLQAYLFVWKFMRLSEVADGIGRCVSELERLNPSACEWAAVIVVSLMLVWRGSRSVAEGAAGARREPGFYFTLPRCRPALRHVPRADSCQNYLPNPRPTHTDVYHLRTDSGDLIDCVCFEYCVTVMLHFITLTMAWHRLPRLHVCVLHLLFIWLFWLFVKERFEHLILVLCHLIVTHKPMLDVNGTLVNLCEMPSSEASDLLVI